MRDEKEERKKEASKVKQQTGQSNTAHPRQSLFLENAAVIVVVNFQELYDHIIIINNWTG